MLSGHARTASATWQGHALDWTPPAPLKPPSAQVLAKPPLKMPNSSFQADYGGNKAFRDGAFKMIVDNGRTRVVSTFPQGFSGTAVERYPSGERYIGDFADGRRHGRGKFTDSEGHLLSFFQHGQPKYEGTKILFDADATPTGYTRTYDGRTDGTIPMDEARAIAANVGLRLREFIETNGKGLQTTSSPAATSKIRSRLLRAGTVNAFANPTSGTLQISFLSRLKEAEARDEEKSAMPKSRAGLRNDAGKPAPPTRSPNLTMTDDTSWVSPVWSPAQSKFVSR